MIDYSSTLRSFFFESCSHLNGRWFVFWAEKTHLNFPTIHYVSNFMIGLKMKPWNNICKTIAKCLISIIFLVHYCFKQLWATHHNPKDIKENTKKSLRALRVDSVQLFLMHWPFGFKVKNLRQVQSGTTSYLYYYCV